MNCENCKVEIPQDECPVCDDCSFVWAMYFENVISHNERVERLEIQRVLVATFTPGYIENPALTTTIRSVERVGPRR